jgi:hypothetical protein
VIKHDHGSLLFSREMCPPAGATDLEWIPRGRSRDRQFGLLPPRMAARAAELAVSRPRRWARRPTARGRPRVPRAPDAQTGLGTLRILPADLGPETRRQRDIDAPPRAHQHVARRLIAPHVARWPSRRRPSSLEVPRLGTAPPELIPRSAHWQPAVATLGQRAQLCRQPRPQRLLHRGDCQTTVR